MAIWLRSTAFPPVLAVEGALLEQLDRALEAREILERAMALAHTRAEAVASRRLSADAVFTEREM